MQPKLKPVYKLPSKAEEFSMEAVYEATLEAMVLPKALLHPFFPRPVTLVLDSPVPEGHEHVTKKGYGMDVVAEVAIGEMGTKKKYERIIEELIKSVRIEYVLKRGNDVLWRREEQIRLSKLQKVYTTVVMVSFTEMGVSSDVKI